MAEQWYLVTMADEEDAARFLYSCLDRATSFRAYFPDDPHLGGGKDLFSTLSLGVVTEWAGMASCLMVSAPLDFVSRELVKLWLVPNDDRKPLWQYEFLEDDKVFFRVEDFSVHMLLASESEVLDFQRGGIDISMWEPISLEGESGIVAQPFSSQELQELGEALGEPGEDDQEPEE